MDVGLRLKHEHLEFRLTPEGRGWRVVIGDRSVFAELVGHADGTAVLAIDGRQYHLDLASDGHLVHVGIDGETYVFHPESPHGAHHAVALTVPPEITAPMPGKVLEVLVKPGDRVTGGDGLVVLEAMKMESRLVAEADAVVASVNVAPGSMVEAGQVLLLLRYDE